MLGVCVFYLLIAPVAQDLDIVFEQQTWVIVSLELTESAPAKGIDIIYSNIRIIPPILGPILGSILPKTRILLRLPRSRHPQPHYIILER